MKKELIILAGFLGSGKTTVLQALLQRCDPRHIAVLLNDFGDVPVDGTLLQTAELTTPVLEIGGGSVFCSCLKEAFVKALFQLAQSKATRVLVEASGMSDPAGVTRMLELAGLDAVYSRPLVFCLFDPVKSLKLSHVLEVIPRQLAAADVAVLTKIDISTSEQQAAARDYICSRHPDLPILESAQGNLNVDDLLNRTVRHPAFPSFGFNTPETRPDSFVIDSRKTPLPNLQALLDALHNDTAVLRVKGYALTAQGGVCISDTGQGFAVSAAPVLPTPLTIICLQGHGEAVLHRLKPFLRKR